MQLDAAEVEFGAFGLEEEFPGGQRAINAGHDLDAVEEIGDVAAAADGLDAIPFSDGFFGVARTAEAEGVFPRRVTILPVDPALGDFGEFAFGGPVLRSGRDCAGEAGRGELAGFPVVAADEDNVSGAAFDDLVFDRAHPGAAEIFGVGAIFALAVEQNAGVAGTVFARGPRHGAPAVFGHQFVVGVILFGHEPAIVLSAYPDGRSAVDGIDDRENMVGVFVPEFR